MSGHSKWATIKHKKAATDAKRGKVFSRLAKELMISARSGGGDPGSNITLRTILGKCKAVNMPADNIKRAIDKGTGAGGGVALEEIMFEAYAGGGVGMIITCLSDNRNRSVAEVRHLLQRHNATLAGTNQVMRNFERKGQILIDAEGVDEDKLTELVLDAGAEDMSNEGGQFEILTAPNEYPVIAEKITAAGYTLGEDSGVNMVPTAWVPVTDKAAAEKLLGLVDALEELDDVQNVYMNGDIAEDAMPAEG
ncbi:MAG: YebC/PmpR family DNA-binding transcriptional regulator [Kiritimatiellae bacterium]|nr:YebC/PmpR family DNA-binding transcriptional regulator [Kiritimatiellia bacterium]MBQ9344641.1 YebC/PmpR family DNA-binding transcriptional regulator [Kiritimatiellia bacterium]